MSKMIPMTMIPITMLLLGCATAPGTDPGRPGAGPGDKEEASKSYADQARALEASGAHLEASFYFEAALAAGGEEIDLLPCLIAAEVRAGRLREAGRNLSRLKEIAEDTPSTQELTLLLVRFAPAGYPRPDGSGNAALGSPGKTEQAERSR